MLKNFLKEVVALVAGKQAEEIADLLNSKKHVNEFLIAKKLDMTINQTRNILYKISDHGLVSSIRKKDKRKGWYTYFWKIEIIKSLEFLRNVLLKKINQFEHQIKSRETKVFYICESCNIEFNEENALLHNFTCPECGKIFTRKDNTKLLRELKRELDRYKKELKLVEEELGREKEKEEKIRVKEIAKAAKARKRKSMKKRAAKKKPVKREVAKKRKPIKKKKAAKKKKPVKKSAGKKPVKKKKVIKKKTRKKEPKIKKKTKKRKREDNSVKNEKGL